MTPLYRSLKDNSSQQLSLLLEQMITRAEKLLAGMADGLEEAEIERHFALADRLKLCGKQLSDRFSQEYQQNFDDSMSGKAKAKQTRSTPLSFDNLAILDDYNLDETVATKKIIAETRTQFLPVLIGLKTRLDNLIGKQIANEDSNPLDPKSVAQVFKRAHSFLEQDGLDNILLFRLFNSCVLEKMGPILDSGNQILIDNKVDSKLRADPRSKPQRRNYAPSFSNNSELEAQLLENAQQQQSFSKLQQLMASSQSHTLQSGLSQLGNLAATQMTPGAINTTAINPNMTASGTVQLGQLGQQNVTPQSPIPTAQLIDTLTELQKQTHDHDKDMRERLVGALQEKSPNNSLIDKNDADAINLVSMIFDTMHQDPDLSGALKQTIRKLQGPILKTALSDKGFFDNSAHPARRLLNEIAKSAELNNDNNTKLEPNLDEIIAQLNQKPEQETALLEQALQDLELDNQKRSLKSEKTQEQEIQKRETELTKQQPSQAASYSIQQLLKERNAPPAVRKLLEGGWQNFLAMIAKKQGTQSKTWRQAKQTAEVLIWSVQDHREKDHLFKLEKMLPRLTGNIRKGLTLSRTDEFETNILLKQLSSIHQEVVKGKKPRWLEQDNKANQKPEAIAAPELAAKESAGLLPIGSWVESEQSGKILRCKLAAHLQFVDRYVFVDRMGVKTMEVKQEELANALETGKIKQVDNVGLFDKALNQVADQLQT